MEPEVRHKPIRYHEIDLLRFIAAISVVMYHFAFRGYYAQHASPVEYVSLARVFKYGYLGVELFFLVSGYVILMSAQGKTLSQFFISRVTRLYPAYWAACTLTFVVVRLFAPARHASDWSPATYATLTGYCYNMTMLQGFFGVPNLDGVYWTLTIEIGFYFLVALLIAFGWIKNLLPFLCLWLGFCALIGPSVASQPFAVLLFPRYAPFFMAGMTFYLLQTKQAAPWKLYMVLLASYLLSMRSSRAIMNDMEPFFQQPFSLPVVWTVMTGCFAVFLLIIHRKIKLGNARALQWAGVLTYPIYLLHHNMGFVALQQFGGKFNKYVLLTALLAILFLLAYALHILVERRYAKVLEQKLRQLVAKA